jgi:CubicO group peptidase (beta-lactamase class C family)
VAALASTTTGTRPCTASLSRPSRASRRPADDPRHVRHAGSDTAVRDDRTARRSSGLFAPFDESLRSGLLGNGALAISVAVAQDGKLLHTRPSGRQPGDRRSGHAASRFRLASNSKLLTATAILELVEAGQLGLDEPVLARLATRLGVAFTDGRMAAVTLRQLLSHTSGMPEYDRRSSAAGGDLRGRGPARPHERPDRAARHRLPLQQHELLPPRPAGRGRDRQAYAAVVQDRVLHPLGIEDMRMAGHLRRPAGRRGAPHTPGRTFMEALAGAGAWIGTATDLVRIIDGLDRSRPGWHPLSAGDR